MLKPRVVSENAGRVDRGGLVSVEPVGGFPSQACLTAVRVLGMDGAGISMLLDQRNQVPLGSSGGEATIAEQLQFTLGQGPCWDAHTRQQPVLVPDVNLPGCYAWDAWPGYAAELVARTGYRAVFALPLSCEGLALGTLNLYRHRTGRLRPSELVRALLVAAQIFNDVLDCGTFSHEGDPANHYLRQPLAQARAVVWQAVGRATIELDLAASDALALLRSYCYAHNQLLDHVANDVITGQLPLHQLHP